MESFNFMYDLINTVLSLVKNRSPKWTIAFLLLQLVQHQIQAGILVKPMPNIHVNMNLDDEKINSDAETSNSNIRSMTNDQKTNIYEEKPRGEIYSHIFVAEKLADKIQELLFGSTGCNMELELLDLDSRVIGGDSAQYGSQPWQVEISEILGDGQNKHYCSGAILNSRNILTTAHCFSEKKNKNSYAVIAGDYDRSAKDDHEQIFAIEKVTIHPDYQKINHFDNDIAVVKIKPNNRSDGFIFGPYVQPSCIPSTSTPHPPGTSCTVSGWGVTQDTIDVNSSAKVLQSAQVKLISSALCQDLYKNYNPVGEGMLCAGHLQGGIDACHGDSGGPLICNITGHQFLTGLVSWGDGCAQPNRPGVYVHVQHYIEWIRATLQLG